MITLKTIMATVISKETRIVTPVKAAIAPDPELSFGIICLLFE
jgi:hypothetical protein